ncbi:GNAT family N-acetyltransferase, partial [Methylococcaceae bacterium CS1]
YRNFYKCERNNELAVEFISKRIEFEDSLILIAVDESKPLLTIVGFTQMYPLYSSTAMKKLWLLNDLFVLKDYRKKGIAKKLIENNKQVAQTSGARGLFLETESTNEVAKNIYSNEGFIKNKNIFYNFDL